MQAGWLYTLTAVTKSLPSKVFKAVALAAFAAINLFIKLLFGVATAALSRN